MSSNDVAPVRLGPYEVGPKIGGGGMATVYAGRRIDSRDVDIVALKVIKDDFAKDPQYVHMFLDEAKILARLSHPDIIATRDYGLAEGSRFIAMELLLGRTMLDVFDRANERAIRIPLDIAAHIALRVARALDYAHALTDEANAPLHLIHRDVNPTNIFLTYEGRVKLIDFGLARSIGRIAKSGEGIVKGKVPYLSPEQVEDKPFDHRADIFALGATLWEMTTGRRLFKRDTDLATLRAIREQHIPDPRTFVEGLYPDALWEVVSHALARDPNERYATAGAMADGLETFLSKHGRKGPMGAELASFIEELFPGEFAKQKEWLAKVSATRKSSNRTMRPPAPLAQVPDDPQALAVAVARLPEPTLKSPAQPQPAEVKILMPAHALAETAEPLPSAPSKPSRHPIRAIVAAVGTLLLCYGFLALFRFC